MKSTDEILKTFSGTTPLMPLPDLVFFPKTVQPLHIFEPRYIEMVRDCLAGERLFTIPMLKVAETEADNTSPPFHEIATMGFINQAHHQKDDTYHVLVKGLAKVEIVEVESNRAYRRGAVTPVREFTKVTDGEKRLKDMLRLFEKILERTNARFDLAVFTKEGVSVEIVTHSIISALPIDPGEKQKMLELQSLELRLEILFSFLQSGLHTIRSLGQFDPILPTNPLWN